MTNRHDDTALEAVLRLAGTDRSARRQATAARFLLSLYDGRGVALYALRAFPPAERRWFVAVLEAYLTDSRLISRHRGRLRALQQRWSPAPPTRPGCRPPSRPAGRAGHTPQS